MKRMKMYGVVFFAAIFLILGGGRTCFAKIQLKMATEGKDVPPPKGITHPIPGTIALKRFARLVRERSNGEIDVEVYFGTLGHAKKLFGATMLGTLDIVAFSTGILSYFKGGEDFSILWAPWLFETPEEFTGWIQSDMARAMMPSIEKNMKMKILGPIYYRTNRMLTTKDKLVWSMKDMKGIKFRTPPSRIFTETFSSWGAIPTPMPYTELFMALKQGVVQGQDNGLDVVVGYQFYTVQNCAMVTDHMMCGYMLGMNMKRWKSLSPAHQRIIEDVRKEVLEWQKPLFHAALREYLLYAASHGMKVIIPDLTEFKKTSLEMNMRLDHEGGLWKKGLYKEVQQWLIENYRK